MEGKEKKEKRVSVSILLTDSERDELRGVPRGTASLCLRSCALRRRSTWAIIQALGQTTRIRRANYGMFCNTTHQTG